MLLCQLIDCLDLLTHAIRRIDFGTGPAEFCLAPARRHCDADDIRPFVAETFSHDVQAGFARAIVVQVALRVLRDRAQVARHVHEYATLAVGNMVVKGCCDLERTEQIDFKYLSPDFEIRIVETGVFRTFRKSQRSRRE